MSENAFDAVVIGSGLGGLTAAALLAKAGRKVCVIERNHSVGGAASAFKKGALTIEPALHQTADPHDPDRVKHAILNELGLIDEIEWVPVSAVLSVKGGPIGDIFDLPVGFDAAHDALSQQFPKSREGFGAVLRRDGARFDGVAELDGGRRGALARQAGARRAWNCGRSLTTGAPRPRRCSSGSSARTRRRNARSPAISATTPTTPATSRGRSSPIAQAGFFKAGGVFIKGGSRVLSMKLAKVVIKAGGSVLLGRDAQRRRRRRVGPSGRRAPRRRQDARGRAAHRSEAGVRQLRAARSGAACCPTPNGRKSRRPMAERPLSISLFSAHFGLNRPPAKLGLDGYGLSVLPEWATSLKRSGESARLFADDPGDRLPGLRHRQLRRDRQRSRR